jgi:hypothetical protein
MQRWSTARPTDVPIEHHSQVLPECPTRRGYMNRMLQAYADVYSEYRSGDRA